MPWRGMSNSSNSLVLFVVVRSTVKGRHLGRLSDKCIQEGASVSDLRLSERDNEKDYYLDVEGFDATRMLYVV